MSDSATSAPDRDRTQWALVAVLWLAGIAAAMQFAKFSIGLDELKLRYAADATEMSFALSGVGVVGLLFGVSAGVLAARLGHRRVLLGALVLGVALSVLQAAVPPMLVLIASRLLEGFSHLAIVVAAPTLMIAVSARRHQSLVMAIWGTFFGVAFALLGWVGPELLTRWGLPALFGGHAALLAALALYLASSSHLGRDAPGDGPAEPLQFLRDNLRVYTTPRTVLPGVIFFFHTLMFIAFLTFVPRFTSDDGTRSFLLIGLPLISIGGTFAAGAISQYVCKPQTLVVVAYAMVAALSAVVALLAGRGAAFAAAAMALLLVSGVIQGSSFATIPHLTKTAGDQARANGAVAQLGNLGATVGPPVFAAVIGRQGATGLIWLVAVICAGGVLSGAIARKL